MCVCVCSDAEREIDTNFFSGCFLNPNSAIYQNILFYISILVELDERYGE